MHPTPDNEQTTAKQADGCGMDIVRGCQQGDRRAQHQLYENCHKAIYRLAVRMVGPQEAADVTQQVFLQAFRKMDTFRLETWLYRLAVNESLQHLRRMRRWQQPRLEGEPADRGPKHDEQTDNRELLDLALARLEPELRSLFLLRELHDLPYRELADATGTAEGTVASRLNRARRLLQEHLIDLGWEP